MAFDPYTSALQNYWGQYQGGSPALQSSYSGSSGVGGGFGGGAGGIGTSGPIPGAPNGGYAVNDMTTLIQKLKGGYNPWDSMRGGNMYDQMLSNGIYSQMTGWKPTFPMGG